MSDRILVGTRKGLFTVTRGESGWTVSDTAFLGDNVPMVLHDERDGTLHAFLDHGHFGGKMHRSRDGGATWDETAVPTYPQPPEGYEAPVSPMGTPSPEWKLKLVWALATGGADQPGTLWAGTIPGGLFRSDDGGDSWELNRPLWDLPDRVHWFGGGADLPGIHSISVHPEDSNRVFVGVSCGGAWETLDGGETWEVRAKGMWAAYMPPEHKHDPVIQDPHCIVRCAAQPEQLWCQHHNGVFRSADGGRNWNEVTNARPSVFGFAVAAHPTDPQTAWFVPALKDEKRIPVDGNVVIGRTRDGGETFEILREGLPQGHAYDITFRHGLDVDGEGQRLAFGSTTGSLWVSEDQGDSWATISRHLPPIYSVCFA